MKSLPPLDAHAHVSPAISARDLENLGAVVCIATRSLDEFDLVRHRRDRISIWGVGCHPNLVGAQRAFDAERFSSAIEATPYVSEVGLDGASRVDLQNQLSNLTSILKVLKRTPRIISLHSYSATSDLISLLLDEGHQKGRILHWWLGDEDQTKTAIGLGCYFSINFSMVRKPETLRYIPFEKMLLETDHPSGDRFSSFPRQPGSLNSVERALARHYGRSSDEVRVQSWKNFSRLVRDTETLQLMPEPVQRMLVFVDSLGNEAT